jgi:hypothetical protein
LQDNGTSSSTSTGSSAQKQHKINKNIKGLEKCKEGCCLSEATLTQETTQNLHVNNNKRVLGRVGGGVLDLLHRDGSDALYVFCISH